MNNIIESKNQEMVQNITEQIESLNSFAKWSDKNLQESRREETYKKIVNLRRQLKRCVIPWRVILRLLLLAKVKRAKVTLSVLC